MAGCASGAPLRPEGQRLPPLVTATADQAGVRDLRAPFRAALCALLAGSPDHPCEKVLTRMGSESDPDGRPFPSVAEQAKAFRIGIVPGFFAECLDDEARPFAAAANELRALGFEVTYLPTTGRGGVATNAEMLGKEISALPDDPRPLILFGYSKGMPDALDLVVRYPTFGKRIAALVGIGGASRRKLPITRSTNGSCQGLRGAVSTCSMPMPSTRVWKARPYARSRSRSR
jgi:hypothetical protein